MKDNLIARCTRRGNSFVRCTREDNSIVRCTRRDNSIDILEKIIHLYDALEEIIQLYDVLNVEVFLWPPHTTRVTSRASGRESSHEPVHVVCGHVRAEPRAEQSGSWLCSCWSVSSKYLAWTWGSARVVCGCKYHEPSLLSLQYTELIVYHGMKNYVKRVISTLSTSNIRTVQ